MLIQVFTNPLIEFPQLLQIWPHRTTEIIRDIEDCLSHPELERMFLIPFEGKIVGITGFYQYDDQVGLNWHGVLSEYRKYGLGLKALQELIPLAKEFYPNATYLIEELPEDREPMLRGFFLKAGFTRTNIHVDKPWITTDTNWIEYRLLLK